LKKGCGFFPNDDLIVPMLRVGMHQVTLCVTGTRSVPGGIPTRSVGTINICGSEPAREAFSDL
jgi:hypothetical protein